MPANLSTNHDYAKHYQSIGWALVPIPAGSKAPSTFSWQTKAADAAFWETNPTHNIGLLHSLSGTVALDIDHMANTRVAFEAMNIDLDNILNGAPRIIGRPDRGKVLFKAPDDLQLTTRKISWPVEGDPRKTEVVFELRAGSVQDVLPPSIHPDTGNPYQWAGPSIDGGLPELPHQLLTLWRDWDRFRPQLADACPWKKAPEFQPPAKKRRVDGEQTSVIDAYNEAVSITEALSKAGYRQFGRRWLSPNSTTGMPGVAVFEDGKAYSHHASDPFDPEHAFDAFEVFVQYEHLGNASAAVKAAAEFLDIKSLPQGPTEEDREMIKHGAAIAASWKKDRPSENHGIPKHLLTVPGVLGEVVTYSAKTAIKPQPQFDVQTALAIGSVVMGRRFVTDNRNMSSLYFLNVGKTGSGKEHANTVIEDCLEAADAMHLRGPSGYTSSSAVLSALNEKPSHIAVIDEFGSMLASASAKGNQNKKDALTMLMEAWGRQTKTLRNVGYSMVQMTDAQKKAMQIEIRSPSLSIIGMTTPETFYEAVGSKDVASGFLNRILIVESKRPRELSRNPDQIDVPKSVTDWIRNVSTTQGEGASMLSDQGTDFPPVPLMIPFTEQARTLLRDYEITITDRQNASSPMIADMMNRSREIAMRLSLIVAVSLGDKEITSVSAQWAIDYVDFYLRQTLEIMDVRISEGDTDGLRKAVAECIKDAGSIGMKMSELIKAVPRLGNLKKHERDGLLAMVVEDFPVEKLIVKPEGKGRPSIIHRWEQDS